MSVPEPYTFLLDFDSTLVGAESLEVMAEVCLPEGAEGARRRARIAELTRAGMEGQIDFGAGLRERLALLDLRREQLPAIVERLRRAISPSFCANRAFLAEHAARIHVLSAGFVELIVPVIEALGLHAGNVHANRLHFDADGRLQGCDEANPLARAGGKAALLRTLELPAPRVLVGDGWSDLEAAEAGAVERFYAYTEHVRRAPVLARAPRQAASFDEVLFDLGLRGVHSYPKSKLKVLLLENIHPSAVEAFAAAGYSVETVAGALDEDALTARQVEKHAAPGHGRELGGAEQVAVLGPAIDVHTDRVALGQQRAQVGHAPRRAQRQALGQVDVQHAHAGRLGQHRELHADVAVADDAQRLAAHLARRADGFVPHAAVHLPQLLRQAAQQQNDLG